MFYILTTGDRTPLLVKYDKGVSYLPVFRSKESAIDASVNLAKSASSAVQYSKTEAYLATELAWDFFKDWQMKLSQQGEMLFIYPMSPKDYGAPA